MREPVVLADKVRPPLRRGRLSEAEDPHVSRSPVHRPGRAITSAELEPAQLTKLGELKQAGLLTDEEFAKQKARLLGP
ncbi:MAG: SHOCT domain-containing protein [Pseudonocardiales bacterium]